MLPSAMTGRSRFAQHVATKSSIRILVFTTLVLLGGCSCYGEERQGAQLRTPVPQKVVARVDGMLTVGRHIDLGNGMSANPHSIELAVLEPQHSNPQRLQVLFYDVPMRNGRRVELGDTVRFTVREAGSQMDNWLFLENLEDFGWIGD